MRQFNFKSLFKVTALSTLLFTLAACDDDDEPQVYRVSITNITHSQPFSPPVAMLHTSSFSFWSIGTVASEALEIMAEGGDGSALLALNSTNPQYQGSTPLFSGQTVEFTLSTFDNSLNRLSIAGMLINTNDAFSGLNSIELVKLQAGQSNVYYTHTYDAGTEFNSELENTIPGPADGGEGFNSARDDVTSVVTFHGGVVTADDNFTESTLSEADKFDNPSLKIVVTAL